MRISDWSSDVCSSDLVVGQLRHLVEIGKEAHVECRKVVEFQIAVRAADDAAAAVIFGADPRAEALVEKADVELDEVTSGAAATARSRSVQRVELGNAQRGRPACRERGGKYGERSVVAVVIKKT